MVLHGLVSCCGGVVLLRPWVTSPAAWTEGWRTGERVRPSHRHDRASVGWPTTQVGVCRPPRSARRGQLRRTAGTYARTAGRRAFSLISPVTRCDAVDRRCPMPAAESRRRDWPGPGDRRQAGVPFEMRAGVRPPVARSCLARRAPNGGMSVVTCRPLCVVQAGPATEAGTFAVAWAKAVAGKGVSWGGLYWRHRRAGARSLGWNRRSHCIRPRRPGRGRGAGGAAPGQPGTVAAGIGTRRHCAGVRHHRRAARGPRHLKVPVTWPWADAVVNACDRITALPQAP